MEDLSRCQPSPGFACRAISFPRIRGNPGRSPVRFARFCSWSSAPPSRTAMTTTTSSIGTMRTWRFCGAFSEFYHGIPRVDWLCSVMNRLDPDLFRACFSPWAAACWQDKLRLVAIDGKTSRRSHNRKTDQKALHLAFATAKPAGDWTTGRLRKIERDHGHCGPHRAPRSQGRAGLDRCHGMQSQHRPVCLRRRGPTTCW
jgi:hypothetical protein